MAKLGVRKSGVLAVLLTVLFASSIFSVVGTSNAFKPYETITIGVVLPKHASAQIFANVYSQIVQPDINAYVAKLPPSRFIRPVRFEFKVVDAGTGTAAESLAQIKKFHQMGVDMIIGGFWSSQLDQATLDYINKNKMVLISPSSNAPSLAQVDNLYRLSPDASTEGTIVAAMYAKLGLTNAIVIERNDAWGNGIYSAFAAAFTANTGNTPVVYSYAADDVSGCTAAIAAANTAAGSLPKGSYGIFLVALDSDCAGELNSNTFASTYPNLAPKVPWFGTDGTLFSGGLTESNLAVLKILSPNPATPHTSKFDDMASRYLTATTTPITPGGIPFDYMGACIIDSGWILAQAVIETRTSTFFKGPGATDVLRVLSDDCSRYFGYSGWCVLNKYGDRSGADWEIYGYDLNASPPPVSIEALYGTYSNGVVSWSVTPVW